MRKRSFYNKSVRLLTMISVLLLLVGILSACGADRGKTDTDDYVYTICGSALLPYNSDGLKLMNGLLYYTEGDVLKRIPIDAALLSGEEVPEDVLEGAGLLNQKAETVYTGGGYFTYTVDDGGTIYTFEVLSRLNQQLQTEVYGKKLVATGADGARLYEADFSDIQEVSYSNVPGVVNVPIQADGEGNVYVLMDGAIYVMDSQGKVTGQISTDGYRGGTSYGSAMPEKLIRCQNGRIYYVAEGKGVNHWRIWELVHENGYKLKELQEDLSGVICDGLQNPAVISRDAFLYEYDPETDAFQKVFSLDDSNLNVTDAQAVFRLNEEYFLVYSRDSDSYSGRPCYLLKKTAVKDLPQKEEIVLALPFRGAFARLEKAVTDFNLANGRYHVTIEDYGYVRGDPAKEEDALRRLDSALFSSDAPDLLSLTELDLYKYASKGVLEDLTPYFEKSESLSIEDYLENIIDAYTINGRLVCIPSNFGMSLFCSRSAQTGSGLGWTFNDLMEVTERYPESRLLDSADYRGADWVWQNILGDYCVERFVDPEKGTCDFGEEEFEKLVRWAGAHHGEGTWVNDLSEDDNLLLKWEEIFDSFSYYMRYLALDGEDVYVLKGYPTVDGSPRYAAYPSDELGIVSSSDKKEGAWAFLEFFMSRGEYREFTGFSSRKADLEERLEYYQQVEYDKGPNGRPIPKETFYSDEDGEYHYIYSISAEQASRLREMLESVDFRPRSSVATAIIDIIVEETQSFYNGDKSMEEIIEIIENRANILVQEAM